MSFLTNKIKKWGDLVAGVSLAAMDIPQVLGYARIAGMPPVTGLYTVFLPLLAFALFGSSRHMVVAADSATATILASQLSKMAVAGSPHYTVLASMTALLTAFFLFLARIFRLGFLANFLSRTVLAGFLAGVGVQVSIAMLGDILGLHLHASKTVEQLFEIFHELPKIHGPSVLLSTLVVLSILILKHYAPRIPIAMIAVFAGILAGHAGMLASYGIVMLGTITGGFPRLSWPAVTWRETIELIPVSASCLVMIIAQSLATGRVFAERHHESVNDDADILGLSVANLATGISGGFVVNGSPTQTAMSELAGAQSQWAQVAFAIVTGIILYYFVDWLAYLPRCILGAIVFSIAVGLIDGRRLAAIKKSSREEFILALITAISVVILGVEQGILLAIALSLMQHVRHSYQPHTMILATGVDGPWQPITAMSPLETKPGLIVYRYGADLFYANDRFFVSEIRRLIEQAPHTVKVFVVDAAIITDMDYSASCTVKDLCEQLQKIEIDLLFARVNRYLYDDMTRQGITACIGQDRVFSTLHEALTYADTLLLSRSQTKTHTSS